MQKIANYKLLFEETSACLNNAYRLFLLENTNTFDQKLLTKKNTPFT